MITMLFLLGLLWVTLKVLTIMVEIPFKALHLVFSALGSTVFWVAMITLILVAVF